MSKLQCTCGHLIVDQTDAVPHKAAVIADADRERLMNAVPARVADFVSQRTPEARRRWLAEEFGPHCPADATDEDVVHYILISAFVARRTMYECASCGRLWLQAGPTTQRFRGYAPQEPGTGALRPVTYINQEDANG